MINGTRYQGKIVFFNGNYGFIKQDNIEQNVFFHINNLNKEETPFKEINLFDIVSFEITNISEGRHKGKTKAENLIIIEKGNETIYDFFSPLTIGMVTKKTNAYIVVYSPQLKKETFLLRTRLLYIHTWKINQGDLMVFHPVRSLKHEWHYFAFFAYKIEHEENQEFLFKQSIDNALPELTEYVNNLKIEKANLSKRSQFIYDLKELQPIDNADKYLSLKELIEDQPFSPSFDNIKDLVEDKYLILLWQDGVIKEYDLDLMKHYFHNSKANMQRWLIQEVKKEHVNEILKYHIDLLDQENKLSRVNNSLKTVLDIVYRNKETRNTEVYKYLVEHLEELTDEELFNLWKQGYLDKIDDDVIEANVDLGNYKELKKITDQLNTENKLYSRIQNYFEDKILSFPSETLDDLNNYLMFLQYNYIFITLFEERYKEILPKLKKIYSGKHKFILYLFRLVEGNELEFKPDEYIRENIKSIPSYFLIRLLLNKKLSTNSIIDQFTIDNESLLQFINDNNWDKVIYPTKEEYPNGITLSHFLPDIETVSKNTSYAKYIHQIDITQLAKVIYNKIPKYTMEHIRLWMEYLCDDKNYFNYVEFNGPYNQLSHGEQQRFKELASNVKRREVEDEIISKIQYCENVNIENNKITCIASIKNIYFEDGWFDLYVNIEGNNHKLRFDKTNNCYESINHDKISIGLNSIPLNTEFAEIPLKFTIKESNNKLSIIKVEGFDYLFTLIDEKHIDTALGVPSGEKKPLPYPQKPSYAEDWQLKLQIIEYLENKNDKFLLALEPKSFRERLDENAEIDQYEKTGLYTFNLDDSVAIIWENIDYSEDRATYVFKSTFEDLERQLQKIKSAIETNAQFRSTLRKKLTGKDKEDLETFKNYYGYVTPILKQRGKNKPFYNWESKILKAFGKHVPVLPTDEEWERIKNKTFVETKSPPKTKRPRPGGEDTVITIDPEDIPIDGDFDEIENNEDTILKLLHELNKTLSEILN